MTLVLEGVSLHLGTFSLQDITFTVADGSITFLVGPSGAGKTVLLEVIAGLHPGASGSIRYDGRDISRSPPERRKIGFVYQDFALFPHMSVARNVEFGLRMSGMPRAERERVALRALTQLHIAHLAERSPATLSGGEQQRVAIARALVLKPGIILLDEPFTALDPRTREDCIREIRDLNRNLGMTILLVSHSLEEARELAGEIVVIEAGKILQNGPLSDVFSHPAHMHIARLAGFDNIIPCTAITGSTSPFLVSEGGIRLPTDQKFEPGGKYLVCIRGETIGVTCGPAPGSSLQESVPARIKRIDPLPLGYRLILDGPLPLTALVSREAVDTLPLIVNSEVFATINGNRTSLIPKTGSSTDPGVCG